MTRHGGRELTVRRIRRCVAATSLLPCTIGVTPAWAQLNTRHIKEVAGLKGGSPPPPHWYGIGPLIYTYNTDTVRDREGDRFPVVADITTVVVGAGINRVTTKKILGGFYG
jgi:hypothetical protein